jgi:hypothetical protein
MPERSIYEQLTGVKVDDTTLTQLDFTKNSFIDTKSIEYWKGIITVSKILDASRTYPHGLPIPEASSIESVAVADAASGSVKPSGTEIWMVQAIDSTADVTYSLYDGSAVVQLIASPSSAPFIPTSPFFLTPTLYLIIGNGSGGEATVTLAYHKVSL